jgi:hypothetical protein
MDRMLRWRLSGEVALAGVSAALALLTVLAPAWLEEAFGFDPDGGNGVAEWLVVAACVTLLALCSLAARADMRRSRLRGGRSDPVAIKV